MPDAILDFHDKLKKHAPDISQVLIQFLAPRAFGATTMHAEPKHVNDPVWRLLELQPWEVSALDLPLMQRLRRVRQLGLAHLVYPSAHHTRFEHSLGALVAATQMFDALIRRAAIDPSRVALLRKCIRLAALFHDCGHGAFSHVSERVLVETKSIRSQFQTVKALLTELFVHQGISTRDGLESQVPAASELLSALLLMTPQMRNFLSQTCGLNVDDQLRIAALILGRAHDLNIQSGGGQHLYLDFVKGLISGDIDADKLDYVARDAYFAGIPIAADVHRLINQLDVIRVPVPKDPALGDIAVAAVLSTGVSTIEMFVLTRGYLFDRIYQHPKIRAAESLLERSLARFGPEHGGSFEKLIKFVYHDGGDDYCIGILSEAEAAAVPAQLSLANRRLPRRALAIAPRYLVGFNTKRRDWTAMLRTALDKAVTEIPANRTDLESKISSLAGGDGIVMVDMPRKSALKENPELYVRRSTMGTSGGVRLEEIGDHFDAAQFAAAYEHVKKTIWIFSDHPNPARVAAVAAITFMTQFGLVPTDEALVAAKVNVDKFSRALDELALEDPTVLAPAVNELRRARGESLALPLWLLTPHLTIGDESECLKAAEVLATVLAKSGLTKQNLDDLEAALVASRWLFEHESRSAQAEKRNHLRAVPRSFDSR